MNELEIIENIRRMAPQLGRSGIVKGIGDDCAIYRPRGSREDQLFTTDLVLEGVHFLRDAHPARAVGWRTLARGLSDIAAMGGTPRFCLISLALAPWTDNRWIKAFYRGLLDLADRTGVVLAGGDLSRAEKVACDVVVCGTVARGRALCRNGARTGDAIYVSGCLGGSALGLEKRSGAAWKTHLRPEPRIELGQFLSKKLCASSAMDLSDGLSLDLRRLCLASGVSALLEGELPVFPGAAVDQALHGGEDYELLFTTRPRTRVPAEHAGIPLTRIGTIGRNTPGSIEFEGHRLEPFGWDPFRKRRITPVP